MVVMSETLQVRMKMRKKIETHITAPRTVESLASSCLSDRASDSWVVVFCCSKGRVSSWGVILQCFEQRRTRQTNYPRMEERREETDLIYQ